MQSSGVARITEIVNEFEKQHGKSSDMASTRLLVITNDLQKGKQPTAGAQNGAMANSRMCTELDRSIDLMKTFGRFCRIAACEDGNNAVELKAYLAAKTVGRGRAHQAA
jgi:hypothetical protein